MRIELLLGGLLLAVNAVGATQTTLPPMPPIPEQQPLNSVQMGDSRSFPEMILDIPVAPGPFEPSWESIEKNYPGEPAWLREAKFGIWVHFGPQSAGESGDWYARYLYVPPILPFAPPHCGILDRHRRM